MARENWGYCSRCGRAAWGGCSKCSQQAERKRLQPDEEPDERFAYRPVKEDLEAKTERFLAALFEEAVRRGKHD